VDTIRFAAGKGTLVPGQKLPTVQEMSQNLGIARGTIKRAYDELERMGLVEKVQGRGTFLRGENEPSGSRKERAMAAIDQLLDSLEDMGFSAWEVKIFLDMKLRQRESREYRLKVAVLECNPENLSQLSEQLRSVEGIEVCSYLMDNILNYPYPIAENMDLIITTTEHAEEISALLGGSPKLVRIALRPESRCLSRIIRIRKEARVGILSQSSRFGQILLGTCQDYNHGIQLTQPVLLSQTLDLESFLADKDAVLLPKDFENHCSGKDRQLLADFAARKRLIPCAYEMDKGSFLYLEERVRRALEEKPI
jgi:DNA-binding transcriptional regulator YhcF (GntR family)